MGRIQRLFRRGEVLTLDIKDMAFGGVGIGKVPTEDGDFTVFVQNTIPGQKVLARVVKCKKRYAECKLDGVLQASPEEIATPYQTIPGAPYANLPIEQQANYKRKTTFELFKRIAKVADIEDRFDEYIESPEIWHYRNKMEYSFSVIRFDLEAQEELDDFGLGFKHRGTWWAVENLNKDSGLLDAEVENKLHQLRIWLEATGYPAWHPPKREGFFRFLVVRKSYSEDKLLFNLVTTSNGLDDFPMQGFIDKMVELYGSRIAGILHTVNDEQGDRTLATDGTSNLIYGEPYIAETLNGITFHISMASFFQTNPKCAEKLYQKVLDYVNESTPEGDVIMDLFCGTGTITQLLANGSSQNVIGVDIVEAAIEDAKANAERNGVSNVEFHAADVGKFLYNFPEYQGKIGTLVLDPPRAGIAPKTLRKVIALGAKRMVYVSCNPATQSRDTEQLQLAGYDLVKFSLVDQFPHTSHVECVALFELNPDKVPIDE
jgi:23S rRNA (uracil1939-C5)-methyltransferase